MVCQLNPHNYSAGLALAGLSQVAAQPYVAEHIYERLMRDVPEQRIPTAQIWFRTLLARGAYDRIMPLAVTMLSEDPEQRGAWLNALLFSARQTRDAHFLAQVQQDNPLLPEWCTELINLEQTLLEDRLATALPRLTKVYRPVPSSYVPYYQVERLLLHGHPDEAGALIDAYGDRMPPDDAGFLRLRVYHAKGWDSLIASEYETLLQYPMLPRLSAQFCAYLIAHPAPGPLASYCDRFVAQGPALTAETIPLYQATYLAAALAGDDTRAEKIRAQIMRFTSSDARVLNGLVELLKAGKPDPRFARILPLVPLPTEVIYAILERGRAARRAQMKPAPAITAPRPPAAVLAIAAVLLGLVAGFCVLLWPQWRQNPDLSHGFFAPVIFALLLWDSRRLGTPRWLPAGGAATAALAAAVGFGFILFALAGLFAASLAWTHALVSLILATSLCCFLLAGLIILAGDGVRLMPFNWLSLTAIFLWLLGDTTAGRHLRAPDARPAGLGDRQRDADTPFARHPGAPAWQHHRAGHDHRRHRGSLQRHPQPALVYLCGVLLCGVASAPPVGAAAADPRGSAPGAGHELPALAHSHAARQQREGHCRFLARPHGLRYPGRDGDHAGFARHPAGIERPATRRTRQSADPGQAAAPRRTPFWSGLGLTALLGAFFVVNSRPALHEGQKPPDLAALLPTKPAGWQVLAPTDLYQFSGILGTTHLMERTYLRRGADGQLTQLTVYVAYWGPGQASVSRVASHTPDACWPGAGWIPRPLPADQPALALPGQKISPGERRLFKSPEGYVQNVWFWHIYDGRVIDYRDPYSLSALLQIALKYGFRRQGDQCFVRVSSNKSWRELAEEPLVHEVFRHLASIGL